MTVIADDNGAHDIAGIMGGAHSGVSEGTTDILLEVAYFTPERIAKTGQALTLTSDARARFERGVDPAFLDDGLAILTGMVQSICGGDASAVVRAGSPPVTQRTIRFDTGLCAKLGGIDVAPREQDAILTRLGFDVSSDWTVTIPSWRRDVDGPADLVEEIVRIVGLDSVQSVPLERPEGVTKPVATASQKVERRVRRAAAARGLNEAITWSFISDRDADAFGGGVWRLANPISEDMRVMRPSLLPGLLAAAQRNADRGADSIRLFELGRRYRADSEPLTLGIVLAGERSPRGWAAGKAQAFDAYDAKAEALALLQAAGVPVANLQVMGFDDSGRGAHYHPGQSGTLRLGPKTVLAAFGTVHPATVKAFGLSGAVVAVEIDLDAVPVKRASGFMRPAFSPSALQVVQRDFAFLVPENLAADALVRAVRGADKTLITSARVFDAFAGAGVPEDRTSLAIEVTLQPTEKSFTEAELSEIAASIVAAAAKVGAVLRG